nr:ribonuclease H-like domain-containing protein [Tanacetum cinerariifolium]
FQDTEKAGEVGTQTYVLFLVLSDGFINPKNNKDAHTDGKEHDDNIQKSVSPDIHSSSCGDQTRKQGDNAKNKDKGKSHVVTITGFRDLNEEFAECINNSSNGVNASGSSVSAAELNFTNSTNDFSAAGPSNAAVPNLEDLSHNSDDVGAEADINNIKSIISVSPIPTTRIYKDHPTSQIIGDLSSTTQTRSMARGVRDQGGISQMFNEDFHTCMFACFLSHEEPKRVHQALKDPSWIEAMQEELLQPPSIGFMRPFGYHVTIFNTLDSLCKFKGKVDEGFFVGYSVNSKSFRVFNSSTRIVQETLHVNFLENKPNITGSSPTWLFDIDSLIRTVNYQPVTAGNQTNSISSFQDKFDAKKAREEINQQYVLFPVWSSGSTNPQNYEGDASFDGKEHDFDRKKPESEDCSKNSNNEVNVAELEDIIYSDDENDVGVEADFNNLETSEEPKRVHQALKYPSWIEAMHEELLQFKMQKAWVLVDFPHRKRAIDSKWVYRNKKDERGIVVRNK